MFFFFSFSYLSEILAQGVLFPDRQVSSGWVPTSAFACLCICVSSSWTSEYFLCFFTTLTLHLKMLFKNIVFSISECSTLARFLWHLCWEQSLLNDCLLTNSAPSWSERVPTNQLPGLTHTAYCTTDFLLYKTVVLDHRIFFPLLQFIQRIWQWSIALTWQFCTFLLPWGHLANIWRHFGVVPVEKGCYWHLVSRGLGDCFQRPEHGMHNKDCLAAGVNSVKT